MRKLCLSLLAISFFMVVLCGCDKVNAVKPNVNFTSHCKVEVDDMTLTLNIISSSDEDVSVEVLSPDNLNGLKYERVNSTLYIDYHGLKCTTTDDYLTHFNPFDVLIDTLVSAKTTDISYMCDADECDVYKGRGENGEYTFFVDKSSGDIKRIKPLYADYEFIFA